MWGGERSGSRETPLQAEGGSGEEEKLRVGQMKIFDKVTLGSVWAVSFLYGLMTEHVVSKQAEPWQSYSMIIIIMTMKMIMIQLTDCQDSGYQVDIPCSVSHDPNNYLGLTSILLAIVLPTVSGPLMAGLVHLIFWLIYRVKETPALAPDTRKMERQNLVCILSLTLVFLPTYISSMILTELYLDIDNIFLFVMVKYILG